MSQDRLEKYAIAAEAMETALIQLYGSFQLLSHRSDAQDSFIVAIEHFVERRKGKDILELLADSEVLNGFNKRINALRDSKDESVLQAIDDFDASRAVIEANRDYWRNLSKNRPPQDKMRNN